MLETIVEEKMNETRTLNGELGKPLSIVLFLSPCLFYSRLLIQNLWRRLVNKNHVILVFF